MIKATLLIAIAVVAATAVRDKTAPNLVEQNATKEDNADNKSSDTVRLGEGDLLLGIPGEGSLKASEIRAWLANPRNHRQLKLQLPVGLDTGADRAWPPALFRYTAIKR
jgi:hypothetical protein